MGRHCFWALTKIGTAQYKSWQIEPGEEMFKTSIILGHEVKNFTIFGITLELIICIGTVFSFAGHFRGIISSDLVDHGQHR